MGTAGSRITAVLGMVAMGLGLSVAVPTAASAAPAGAVPWSHADFHGYASGTEVHLGAITVSGKSVADTEQGYSGASANTAGLTTPVVGDNGGLAGTGLLVQPTEPAPAHSFGTGAGLEVGLVAPADASGDQLQLAGLAAQTAPPNKAADVVSIPSASCPETNNVPQCLQLPAGLAAVGALSSEGAAVWDSSVCPLGQPLSYGFGDAADASLISYNTLTPLTSALGSALSQLGITVPTSGQIIQNLGDAKTSSETYLASNGDGTFGLSTRAQLTLAPVSINLFGVADLELEVGGQINPATNTANPAVPISLTATATGEGHGAKVALGANDVVSLTLKVGNNSTTILPATSLDDLVGQGGLVIQLDPRTLVGQLATAVTNNPVLNKLGGLGGQLGSVLDQINTGLQPVTSQLPDVSLGEIAIGTPVRAINSDPASKSPGTPAPVGTASTTEGTAASGAFDLARVSLAPTANGTTTPLVNFYIGHLEAAANLAAPVTCNIPIIKTADPTSVTAGNPFTYNIQVPDPAKLDLIDCNLDNITVTDTISDVAGAGQPTFTVESPKTGSGVTVNQIDAHDATVTWTGLSYKVAPTGQPPNPPIALAITVSVPASSPSGTIQDTVVATGVTSGCQGGVGGSADVTAGAGGGATLTGSYSLQQPSVGAATSAPATGPSAQTAPASLPRTGSMGGPWQPLAGLAALAAGGGALGLVRRARRLRRQ